MARACIAGLCNKTVTIERSEADALEMHRRVYRPDDEPLQGGLRRRREMGHVLARCSKWTSTRTERTEKGTARPSASIRKDRKTRRNESVGNDRNEPKGRRVSTELEVNTRIEAGNRTDPNGFTGRNVRLRTKRSLEPDLRISSRATSGKTPQVRPGGPRDEHQRPLEVAGVFLSMGRQGHSGRAVMGCHDGWIRYPVPFDHP